MAVFLVDKQELKDGLIIFRRADVAHKNWYCRARVPKTSQYKTISLGTPDINEARNKAFDHDADIRFRIKHDVPVFEKLFSEVAADYSVLVKQRAEAGQITMHRWETVDGHIRLHLNPYVGNLQIMHVSKDHWDGYFLWRKQNGKTRAGNTVRNGSIRQEMKTFRAVMKHAADRKHIPVQHIPDGKLPLDKARREEFTPQEYRKLHTFARAWTKESGTKRSVWMRTVAYNFVLVMTNTGMRPSEARNLRWRDIDNRKDKDGRAFIVIKVRGKGKFRELVAPPSVGTYLERIKATSTTREPDNFIFTTYEGKQSQTLYHSLMRDLFTTSGLIVGPEGTERSTYSFRHTYATFRLTEGVDVYFLAKQMGTSVKMIEDHYGHITPAKNAARILEGIPGWQPMAEDDGGNKESVNALPAGG